jgi:phosphohistidine phosphatase SixA
MTVWRLKAALGAALGLMVLAAASVALAEPLSGTALVHALRKGGYVLVMRHASSPMARPDAATADPENPGLERQLDAKGKATAIAEGRAMKALRIPIGEALSSPTYRAMLTVRLLALAPATARTELGDAGQSMTATGAAPAAWLRDAASRPPRPGANTLIVTHLPNIAAAFSPDPRPEDSETLVFHPDGKGGSELVARVKAEDWARLE